MPTDLFYGHLYTQIEQTTPEEIMAKFDARCDE